MSRPDPPGGAELTGAWLAIVDTVDRADSPGAPQPADLASQVDGHEGTGQHPTLAPDGKATALLALCLTECPSPLGLPDPEAATTFKVETWPTRGL